jgi:rod shape-determining protein MreC
MRLFANIGDARDQILTAFLLLVSVAVMMVRSDGGLQNLRVASVVAISYLEQPLSLVRIYRQALMTNRDLRRENILLQDEISRLRSAGDELTELRAMLGVREDPDFPRDMIATGIIAKSLTGLNNSLTIDKGKTHGIKEGMAIINSKGLIGRVILVSEAFSLVMPMSNSLFRVSAMVQGTRAFGIVSWEGKGLNELVLNYVPRATVIEPGMVVETSGYSNDMPAHIPIGVVTGIVPEPGRETQRIYIRPFANLSTLAEGFAVPYTPVAELDSLNVNYQELF